MNNYKEIKLGIPSLQAATDTVTITNFADLKSVAIKVTDEKIATGKLESDKITFTAVAVGNTTCDITATDAVKKTITITVTAPTQITTDKDKVELTTA